MAYQEVRYLPTLINRNITEDSCSHESRPHQIKRIEKLYQTCKFFIFRSGIDVVALSFLLAHNIPSLVNHSPSRPSQALKKKTVCRLVTSATNYPVRWCHVPEQQTLQCHTCFVFNCDSTLHKKDLKCSGLHHNFCVNKLLCIPRIRCNY